ncbi:MAG: glutamate racemase, partial [Clostridia bacterium]|nr:glutamate racemase [Clostridia bacterium]
MTGFIDSGAGGFSALRAFRRRFPLENVCFFADSLHLPYGEKSPEELTRYTLFACSFLFARGADRIVFACGTASALALPALSGLFPFLYGATEPAAKAAAKATVNGKIGILATKGTVR